MTGRMPLNSLRNPSRRPLASPTRDDSPFGGEGIDVDNRVEPGLRPVASQHVGDIPHDLRHTGADCDDIGLLSDCPLRSEIQLLKCL